MPSPSSNFSFLLVYDELLVKYGAGAERYIFSDPNTALMKLRQYGELLTQLAAARAGVYDPYRKQFLQVLQILEENNLLSSQVSQLFHGLRKAGNDAVHLHSDNQRLALHQLQMAHQLGIWFHRTYGDDSEFETPPFVPPPDPEGGEAELLQELKALRQKLQDREKGLEETREKGPTEEQLLREREAFDQKLLQEQQKNLSQVSNLLKTLSEKSREASNHLHLNEADTRKIIDAQLREAGWETDSQKLRYSRGVRPQKGKAVAIAEWPTESGPADYVLFVGLTPLAVVEAKRKNKDVSAALNQSSRYSQGFFSEDDEVSLEGPWGKYKIPFLFSTNGRPYLRQIRTKSGIWFRDARRDENIFRPLREWYTPKGLLALLEMDEKTAQERLEREPLEYLPLRFYQTEAISAIEDGLGKGKREMMVAMATGTGKTRMCIGLVYRLIKTERFRRILFIVDRSALGEQATNAFKNLKIEDLQSFTNIYDLKEMSDKSPEDDTRLHIVTIQGLMKRLFFEEKGPLPIDLYDCLIVDECHRGYTLDKEMSEDELKFRSLDDYVSQYRRVLDHFDAVKIGLTATPALHTTEIFGKPVYEYSYRQAVIDGFLVDHEPPLRITTELAEDGITWKVAEQVEVFNPSTQQVDLHTLADEVTVEIEEFNKRVLTENFNQVICEELARQIDLDRPGKTLIFCVNDSHADTVVDLLKEAYQQERGRVIDDAIKKITGAADQPLSLIRHYKNERFPQVAVTVDLLTTGIDVPEIVNIVFIRRVKSRILYEQMLGRGTRRCDTIGKEAFCIFDCVDLYSSLQDYSSMKPVVTRPNITFEQLFRELVEMQTRASKEGVKDQIIAKFQRKKRTFQGRKEEEFEAFAGMKPEEFSEKARAWSPKEMMDWFSKHPELPSFLDRMTGNGTGSLQLISHHPDEIRRVERGYGTGAKPEDYIESFRQFIETHKNEIPALVVALQRPYELTRRDLKDLKKALDFEKYSETSLKIAYKETTNQDFVATLLGYIRSAALGSPLIPYEERVEKALAKIMKSQEWNEGQKKWLKRIGKQLKKEIIVDREALNRAQFKRAGGYPRMNKDFKGELERILRDLHREVWKDPA